MVLDGRRRFFSLEDLLAEGAIDADYSVRCELFQSPAAQAAAAVLTATEQLPVHTADVIVAIGKLRKLKMDTAAIAKALGYDELEVRRLEKLAAVHPNVLKTFRKGALTLRQVRLFARVADRKVQGEIAATALSGYFHDYHLQQVISEGQVTTQDPRLVLVGLARYGAAGGRVESDLFGELPDRLLDPEILQDLWRARIQPVVDAFKAEDPSEMQDEEVAASAGGRREPEVSVPQIEVEVTGASHVLHETRTDVATRGLIRDLADDPAAALTALVAQLFKHLIRRDAATGAETKVISFEVRTARALTTSTDALAGLARSALEFVVNGKSRRAGLVVRGLTTTDDEDRLVEAVRLIRPERRSMMPAKAYQESAWEPVAEAVWQAAWDEEVAAADPWVTRQLILATGLLLPVWKSLPAKRTFVDGRRWLGRVLDGADLAKLKIALGLSDTAAAGGRAAVRLPGARLRAGDHQLHPPALCPLRRGPGAERDPGALAGREPAAGRGVTDRGVWSTKHPRQSDPKGEGEGARGRARSERGSGALT